jgi:hypothetical protein
LDPEQFWRQTPRVNRSAVKGRLDGLKRDHHLAIREARWAGWFAQVKLSEHDKAISRLLDDKKPSPGRIMTGKEIGSAMRAWVKRSG